MQQARVEMYCLRAGRPRAGVDAIATAKTGCLQERNGGFGGQIPFYTDGDSGSLRVRRPGSGLDAVTMAKTGCCGGRYD